MTVTAPPRPPALPQADLPPDPEALIKEARRRARRRRLCYLAAGLLAAGAGAAAFFGFNGGGGSTRAAAGGDGSVPGARLPRSAPAPAHPANGVIAVPADNDGQGGIYALDGGLGQPLFECRGDRNCWELESAAFSPDGRKLAFSVTSYAIPSGYDGLHVLDLPTRKDVKVGPSVVDLAWSRDGTKLAGAFRLGGIFVIDADGTTRALFPGTREGDYSPTWSPTGQVAFARHRKGSTIWVLDRLGGRPRVLTNGDWPAWSPDGSRIAFRSTCGIRFMTPVGRDVTPGPKRVTSLTRNGRSCKGIGVAGAPTWSPDGRKLAIAAGPKGAPASVFVVNADGSNLHRVGTSLPPLAGGEQVRPAWQAKPRM